MFNFDCEIIHRGPVSALGWAMRASKKLGLTLFSLFALHFSFVSCSRTEDIPLPGPSERVVIGGKIYAVERRLFDIYELSYPPDEVTEEGVAVRIMLDGAVVTADIPTRLLGQTIDLKSRDSSPDLDGLFFAFHLSVRGGDGLYCRVNSWDTTFDSTNTHHGGRFTIARGDAANEWVFEWTVTDGTRTVSEGHVEGIFEQI